MFSNFELNHSKKSFLVFVYGNTIIQKTDMLNKQSMINRHKIKNVNLFKILHQELQKVRCILI